MTAALTDLLHDLAGLHPALWAAASVAGLVLYRSLRAVAARYGAVEVTGRINRLCRNGVVQIDVGETDRVAVGQVFTVYKRLAMREVWQDGRPEQVVFTPVGQIKVVSTTGSAALGKFRPIRGYSYNPGLGDMAHYSSRVAPGKIAPLPGD